MNWIVAGAFGLALYAWGRRNQDDAKGPGMPESEAKEGGISIYCDHDTGEVVIEVTEDEGDEVIAFTLDSPETAYEIARAISMAAMRIEAKRDGQADSKG